METDVLNYDMLFLLYVLEFCETSLIIIRKKKPAIRTKLKADFVLNMTIRNFIGTASHFLMQAPSNCFVLLKKLA